jgi:formate dehydrogenase gamma subunit
VHGLRGIADPDSKINRFNVANTCGLCHQASKLEYDQSIHGRALRAGVFDAPTCTDCHGGHLVLATDDPEGPICGARLATETCGKCHDDPVIITKYGLEDGVVGSYMESYHGWSSRNGCDVTASCADCHTAHMVLPAEDPQSTVSEGRVVETCGACHEGATAAFAGSYNHRTASLTGNPVNRTIRSIYLWAIAILIGGMLLHNLVIMNYFMVMRRRESTARGETIRRFTTSWIVQHTALTVSFVVLAITGFALRMPDAFWVRWLVGLGMTEGLRGDLHRWAAVLLMATSLFHGIYLLSTKRGRWELKALSPSRKDFADLRGTLRHYLFRDGEKVRFGRYDYSQKAEYWSLVWGTLLMAATGLILWFPVLSARIFPAVVIPASQTIHYYEAVLATLVIVVWHLFFVVFHPEAYPMSWTWITGRMSKAEAMTHHREWYDEEVESQESGVAVEDSRGRISPSASAGTEGDPGSGKHEGAGE